MLPCIEGPRNIVDSGRQYILVGLFTPEVAGVRRCCFISWGDGPSELPTDDWVRLVSKLLMMCSFLANGWYKANSLSCVEGVEVRSRCVKSVG